MRIIEGTVSEIVEYQRFTGNLPTGVTATINSVEPGARVVSGPAEHPAATPESGQVEGHVDSRARNPVMHRRVTEYLVMVRSLGAIVEAGESAKTRDGLSNYLMVRDDGPRRFGAVAYIRPANGGLTLRLSPADVSDQIGEVVRARDVRPGNEYGVICPLSTDGAVEAAVELTSIALKKVRR